MANKTVGRFIFKDNLTSIDYQKILIEPNNHSASCFTAR